VIGQNIMLSPFIDIKKGMLEKIIAKRRFKMIPVIK
jgi:hypothetical protein